ncbi:MAG: hypothetical protein RLZZ175_1920 [Bacteroidota bacterium]|jgi:hypothetical protein
MRQLIFTTLISLFIIQNTFGQLNDDYSFLINKFDKKQIINNKIDSIHITILLNSCQTKRQLSFNMFGNLTQILTKDSLNQITSKVNLVYDKNGLLTNRVENERNYKKETIYTYNTRNQIIKSFELKNGVQATTTFIYKNNKLKEEIRIEGKSKLITKYQYDSKDNLIEYRINSVKGGRSTESLNKKILYDINNNKEYEIQSFLVKDTTQFYYNDKNQLTQTREGSEIKKYYFDNNNLLIKTEIEKKIINQPLRIIENYEYFKRE